jgi:hypothetical protein
VLTDLISSLESHSVNCFLFDGRYVYMQQDKTIASQYPVQEMNAVLSVISYFDNTPASPANIMRPPRLDWV